MNNITDELKEYGHPYDAEIVLVQKHFPSFEVLWNFGEHHKRSVESMMDALMCKYGFTDIAADVIISLLLFEYYISQRDGKPLYGPK